MIFHSVLNVCLISLQMKKENHFFCLLANRNLKTRAEFGSDEEATFEKVCLKCVWWRKTSGSDWFHIRTIKTNWGHKECIFNDMSKFYHVCIILYFLILHFFNVAYWDECVMTTRRFRDLSEDIHYAEYTLCSCMKGNRLFCGACSCVCVLCWSDSAGQAVSYCRV